MTSESSVETAFGDDSLRSRTATVLFGDRVGMATFVAALLLFTLFWIFAWRINDSLTLMNTLAGMSEGNLHISEVKYGSQIGTPGTHQVGDRVVGRNYGILTLSLLPLVAIEALAIVADLRIALVGLFSLGVLALALLVGRIVNRERAGRLVGSALAVVLFAGNVAFATDLDPASTELYALQVTHMIAAGFVIVLAYRLLTRVHGRRVGLFCAALVALATPVGLWAAIPKRHVFSAVIVLFLGYALYRSRVEEVEEPGSGLRYRVASYAAIGLFAWIHAPEALVLLLVFAVVDLPTARNDVRSLSAIAIAMGLATIPFLVTNYLLSGSPVTPPRMLSGAGASTGEPSFGGGGGGGGGAGGGGAGGLIASVLGTLNPILSPLLSLVSLFQESLVNVVQNPDEILAIFLRSGYLGGWVGEQANYESVNLAILESAPVLAATLGVVPATIARLRNRMGTAFDWPPSPERILDAYLVLFTVAFSLLYISRLPVHAQITVRYMLPIFPALVVLIVRLPAIRGVLADHWQLMLWTYAVAVLIGGQFLVVALVVMTPGVGEAFQLHAWIGLAVAVPLGVWSLAGRHDGWWGRAGAVLIGLAAATVTVFLLLTSVDYFTVSDSQALPLVRVVADIVSIV